MDDKRCPQCKRVLSLALFPKRTHSPNGKHPWCRECKQKYARKYNKLPAEQKKTRKRYLATRYNISLKKYEELHRNQNGMCFLCSKVEKPASRNTRLCVDHNHNTGKIRGLLCDNCNRALGMFGDDYRVLQRAANYLEFHNGPEANN